MNQREIRGVPMEFVFSTLRIIGSLARHIASPIPYSPSRRRPSSVGTRIFPAGRPGACTWVQLEPVQNPFYYEECINTPCEYTKRYVVSIVPARYNLM